MISSMTPQTMSPSPRPAGHGGPLMRVTRDLACLQVYIVNVFFYGDPSSVSADGGWTLIDAGMPWSAGRIAGAAERFYGRGARPNAIVLTHGHFDHVGALEALSRRWDVPVYAHPLELPYLTGRSSYPPPDPTVGGGFMARSAKLYPRGPVDVSDRVRPLPDDGSVPGMPGWRWVHTPGHTAGHVALFRESDRSLIAGDAFVTTKQESLLSVLTQRQEVHGPPKYYTTDWAAARESVRALADLRPAIAATGHGIPMTNPRLAHELNELARNFDELAVPRHGRYVNAPAITDETGVVAVPPPVTDPVPLVLLAAGIAATAAAIYAASDNADDKKRRWWR